MGMDITNSTSLQLCCERSLGGLPTSHCFRQVQGAIVVFGMSLSELRVIHSVLTFHKDIQGPPILFILQKRVVLLVAARLEVWVDVHRAHWVVHAAEGSETECWRLKAWTAASTQLRTTSQPMTGTCHQNCARLSWVAALRLLQQRECHVQLRPSTACCLPGFGRRTHQCTPCPFRWCDDTCQATLTATQAHMLQLTQ